MATQMCQKCKQAHPGRVCDYDEKGECAETIGINEVVQTGNESSKGGEHVTTACGKSHESGASLQPSALTTTN